MKEDVENLPEKEEVVVWVQLTQQQRAYYKALYSNQVRPALLDTSTPSSTNWDKLAIVSRELDPSVHPQIDHYIRRNGMSFVRLV